jgi:hypothetical protein
MRMMNIMTVIIIIIIIIIIIDGNSITCTINCNHTIAATLYTIETWFVAGTYILVNTLHKDYDDDDDDNNNNNNKHNNEIIMPQTLFLIYKFMWPLPIQN